LGDPLVKFGQIRAILFPANRAHLPRRLPDKADVADLVFTTTGDRAEGTLLSVSSTGVVYKSNRREVDVTEPLRNVAGIWLIETEPAPKEPAHLLMTVLTTDGSSIRGEVESLKDGVLTFKDLYGQARKVPRSALAALHVKNGRIVYLSDLEPAAVEEDANYIRGPKKLSSDLDYPFQRDRSARGSPLLLGDTEHRKGLGVRAHSSLTYALDGAFARFQAVVGLDAASNGLGAVTAEVHVDGKKAAVHTFKGSAPAQPVDVDVKGAKELRLVVTWAGYGQSDFADWGSARLLR
ncbi:MAG TPA: NPCBM/NEW2 domain-containing protein, partial [Planctomycetota bacterium]|nr:NPCBM/NEW2 domain-containing protein [Planctomycetota bacterium]